MLKLLQLLLSHLIRTLQSLNIVLLTSFSLVQEKSFVVKFGCFSLTQLLTGGVSWRWQELVTCPDSHMELPVVPDTTMQPWMEVLQTGSIQHGALADSPLDCGVWKWMSFNKSIKLTTLQFLTYSCTITLTLWLHISHLNITSNPVVLFMQWTGNFPLLSCRRGGKQGSNVDRSLTFQNVRRRNWD